MITGYFGERSVSSANPAIRRYEVVPNDCSMQHFDLPFSHLASRASRSLHHVQNTATLNHAPSAHDVRHSIQITSPKTYPDTVKATVPKSNTSETASLTKPTTWPCYSDSSPWRPNRPAQPFDAWPHAPSLPVPSLSPAHPLLHPPPLCRGPPCFFLYRSY